MSNNGNDRINIDPKDIAILSSGTTNQLNLSINTILDNIDKIDNICFRGKMLCDSNNNEIFLECFNYEDKNNPKEDEKRISTLFDTNNNIIGYRFYESYNILGNSLMAINDGKKINSIDCGISIQDPPIFISDDINRKLYTNKFGKSIKGKSGYSHDYLSVLNEMCEKKQNNKCCISPISLQSLINSESILKKANNYNDLDSQMLFDGEITRNKNNKKNIMLLPIKYSGHSSVLVIDLEHPNKFYSFDSSLVHRDPRDRSKLDENIFGSYLTKYTNSLINDINLQFNGTCTYWTDAFCEVVATSPEYNGDGGLQKIINDCKDGTMFLKCAKSIGRIFDEENKPATVMIYGENQDIDDNYYNFKINGKDYGISKTSGLNKFVNLETLVETLGRKKEDGTVASPSEQEEIERIKDLLKNQIKGQKKIREKEREIVNFERLEKAKEKYENFVNKRIEDIDIMINANKSYKITRSNLSNDFDNEIKKLEQNKTDLEAERDSFREKFDKCKRLYDNTNRKHISLRDSEPTEEEKENIKNSKYNWLRLYVKDNVDLSTVAENDVLCDYINSFELSTKINNLVKQMQTFEVMKSNNYKFDFCSEVGEVMNTEETITTARTEQPMETTENQETAEAELNGTITEKPAEARPNTPNPQPTNPLSSILIAEPTNTTNPPNPKPPKDLKNLNEKTPEKISPQFPM